MATGPDPFVAAPGEAVGAAAGTVSTSPGWITLASVRSFACSRTDTLMPKELAMPTRLSPFVTVYAVVGPALGAANAAPGSATSVTTVTVMVTAATADSTDRANRCTKMSSASKPSTLTRT